MRSTSSLRSFRSVKLKDPLSPVAVIIKWVVLHRSSSDPQSLLSRVVLVCHVSVRVALVHGALGHGTYDSSAF